MLNFTTIDFETANYARGSVCAVGIAAVRGGSVVHQETFTIYPPTGLEFTNTWLHGITEDDVTDSPDWEAAAARIIELAADTPLVSYSPFDKGVWNAAWKIFEKPGPAAVFLDALALTKLLLPGLAGYKLPAVNRHLGLPAFDHHEPGADALACANIVLALAEQATAEDTVALWEPVESRRRRSGARFAPSTPIPDANVEADPTHPLYGEVVCFSGDLDSYTRAEARTICANLGASITAGVTRKTSVLVMGGFDPATLRPGATISSKVQKARDLAVAGQRIEIIPESTFLELLEL